MDDHFTASRLRFCSLHCVSSFPFYFFHIMAFTFLPFSFHLASFFLIFSVKVFPPHSLTHSLILMFSLSLSLLLASCSVAASADDGGDHVSPTTSCVTSFSTPTTGQAQHAHWLLFLFHFFLFSLGQMTCWSCISTTKAMTIKHFLVVRVSRVQISFDLCKC